MSHRDKRGRYARKPRVIRDGFKWTLRSLVLVGGLYAAFTIAHLIHLVEPEVVYAENHREPVVVLIEAKVDWTEPGRIEQHIQEVFGTDASTAIRVAKCESSLQPNAFNDTNQSNDQGIFQISEKYHKDSYGDRNMFDVKENVSFAKELFDEKGWSPWIWSKHCWGV